MSKVLFLVGDYIEDYEIMVPFQAIAAVGHKVVAVCPDKKAGDFVKTAIHDFEGYQTYSEKLGHNFTLNGDFDKIDLKSFDALVIPGGRAPEYLRLDERVLELVKYFANKNKPIAAISHGIQILTSTNLLHKKKCSACPTCAPEIREVGGYYEDIKTTDAITDGNLVTAPSWLAHPALISKLLALLDTTISI